MLPKNLHTVIFHITGWLLFFGLIVSFVAAGSPHFHWNLVTLSYLIFYGAYVGLFYLNYSVLFPVFYLNKKYVAYFAIVVALLVGFYFLRPFDRLHTPPQPNDFTGSGFPDQVGRRRGRGPAFDIISLILFAIVLLFGAALQIAKQWRVSERRAVQAEADKTTAELSFLKAQINPHFLFNTLNNIYSMAVMKSEKTADSILKLSNIMRYITDEVTQHFVPLQSEVDCAGDYIDLQKMRLSDRATVNFTVSGNIANKNIAPLLLMTFIENVFKYGTSNHEPSTIIIKIVAEENTITFFTENRLYNDTRKLERAGIGISNAKRRLEHLYPEKHLLNITSADGMYRVKLVLIS